MRRTLQCRSVAAMATTAAGGSWAHLYRFTDGAGPSAAQVGLRARHLDTGFTLDLLALPFVPQALVWVSTPPRSDGGESHTQEHVLLGKGHRAKYVCTLNELSLATTTAFTCRPRTCYTMQTLGGHESFFTLLREKLLSLLEPDMCDDDISREVCHWAVDEKGEPEEKGCVYNEEKQSHGQALYRAWQQVYRLLYGEGHPLSFDSGGTPEGIRATTVEALRAYHRDHYLLSRMGAVVALPPAVGFDDALAAISRVLGQLPRRGDGSPPPPLPPPRPAPHGTVRICHFPNENKAEQGSIVYTWPGRMPDDSLQAPGGWQEYALVDLFLKEFGSGSSSALHKALIAEATRERDYRATSVSMWLGSEPGRAIHFSVGGVSSQYIDESYLSGVVDAVQRQLRVVAGWSAGDAALAEFNKKVLSAVRSNVRGTIKFLQSPPRFGVRGVYDQWLSYLDDAVLLAEGATDVELSYEREAQYVRKLLQETPNPWGDLIGRFQLAELRPIAVAAVASPQMREELQEAEKQRKAAFLEALPAQLGVSTREEALATFRERYQQRTAEIEQATKLSADEMPSFTDDPPMTQDPSLPYEVYQISLPGGRSAPLLQCSFPGMGRGAHLGVVLSLAEVPAHLLAHLPIIASALCRVGLFRDGERIAHDEVSRRIEDETLGVGARMATNRSTGRLELVFSGSGLEGSECADAAAWMRCMLHTPDWTEANLSRIRDTVDSRLDSQRKALDQYMEHWVNTLAYVMLHQTSLSRLASDCIFTREHALLCIRWRLRDPDSAAAAVIAQFEAFGGGSASAADAVLGWVAGGCEGDPPDAADEGPYASAVTCARRTPPKAAPTVAAAAKDLRHLLKQLPYDGPQQERTVPAAIWSDELRLLLARLSEPPSGVLGEWAELMEHARRGAARAFLAAGPAAAGAARELVEELLRELSAGEGAQRHVDCSASDGLRLARPCKSDPAGFVTRRWQARRPQGEQPAEAWGMCIDSLTQGAVLHSVPGFSIRAAEWDRAELRRFLVTKAWCGGGAHTPFVRTWGAGLAYSNGISCSASEGRILYYADCCPEVAKTLAFAERCLLEPSDDTPAGLADYALCQCFSSRAGSSYESRCESMASDITDGDTPARIERFRKALLQLRPEMDSASIAAATPAAVSAVFPSASRGGPPADPANLIWAVGPRQTLAAWAAHTGLRTAVLFPSDFWVMR
eukprot:TRINITY_DN4070_c0_g1_i1.p1 TRINITY_DN4070_c0_g1~~TRINITY_DN4070_c0_g1_i1.p1  ORF type:complete len:1201 (+),score=331.13 TRINITY_DN4070_c0_g1_i1:50-3652(+)